MSKLLSYPYQETKRVHQYFGYTMMILPILFYVAAWAVTLASGGK